MQCASFILAQKAREKFGIRTSVEFGALDNAPYDVVQSVSKHAYQRTYYHALSKEELNGLVQGYYLPYFGKLQELTNVPFEASTYTDIQGNPVFRKQFLATLKYFDLINNGSKTIEVRVAYGGMKKIAVGDVIRFESGHARCDRKVTRVAQYKSFDEMMATENPKKINPTKSAQVQLADIKKIFPLHKE